MERDRSVRIHPQDYPAHARRLSELGSPAATLKHFGFCIARHALGCQTLQEGLDSSPKGFVPHRADDALNEAAVFEDAKGGNSHHLETHCQFHVLVDIYFGDFHVARQFL